MLYHPQQETPSRCGGQAVLAQRAAERRPCIPQTGHKGKFATVNLLDAAALKRFLKKGGYGVSAK